MSKQERDKVFVSYSHEDKKWEKKLKTMLQPLQRKGKIIFWDDDQIKPGQKWESKINAALDTAKIAVLLVSGNFLASDFIMDKELPVVKEAEEKGECKIGWMLLSECLYEETGLNEIQALHDIKRPLAGLKGAKLQETLADIARKIKGMYEEEVKIPPPPLKQIKILSITASPEDVKDLYYEMEQDIMLEAFKAFDREELFLDMPDPVKSTLTEIADHLKDGKHDILHITAHGGINKKGEGVLSLEDQWGKLHEVTGELLLRTLVPPPRIVILSACHSAREEPDLMPVAQAIFKAGIDIVIGMKKAVSHFAAIEFNVAFFNALCQNKTVKQAFEQGKDAILKGEQQRTRDMPGWDALNEYEIPQLLVRKKDENLTRADFSDHRIAAPGRPESHHFMGARYLERGFIGRRQVLRDIYRSIENKEGAIVLKGPGGIGKSTLTTRAAANLRIKGYDFIVVQGETTIEQILEAISKKAASCGVKDADKVYAANADVKDKLGWYLDQFLLKQKMMIIFDNFEENQDEEKGDFHRERLKKFLWFFREALKNKDTFLFFSTRYRLPGFAEAKITKEIPEFSDMEFRKMLRGSEALKRLDLKSIEKLRREIGGNPRGMELLDKIAHEEFKQKDFSWEQLKELIPELQERIIQKAGEGDDFTPLFLDKLFTYLTEFQRVLLDILAIFRNPVPMEAIKAHQVTITRPDRKKLAGLSLLECIEIAEKSLYYVHRLTAQYLLAKMGTKIKHQYHLRSAQYFENIKDEEGKIDLYDLIESRWHYLQAGEWNKAASITLSLESYLTLHGFPQWSMELLQELDIKKLDKDHQLVTYGRIGTLYQDFGEYDKAIEFHTKAYEIAQKNNDLKNSSTALHQIGIIYQEKGDYNEALKQYQKSLEIAEKIGDIKGMAYSFGQIGNIYYFKGEYDEALIQYQQVKEISEKIEDIKSVSTSLHQIGIIYQYKGDYDEALKQYQKSLEISEKIGDIKSVSKSLHQIGMIYEDKGDYDEALKQYQKSIEIREKIGDIKGISESLHQIGIIYQYKGDYDEALKQYQKSLEIKEKIGDINGLAISLYQVGHLHFQKKEFATALKLFIQAFLIFTKIGSPNANKAKNAIEIIREKLPEEQFQEILKEFDIKE